MNDSRLIALRAWLSLPLKTRLFRQLLNDPRLVSLAAGDARVQNAALLHPSSRPKVIDRFHQIYYDATETWAENRFLGFRVEQLPLDLWLYQELLTRQKPAFVLQTGVYDGGSLLFFAHLLDLIGAAPEARVVGVDITLTTEARKLDHPRIRLIEGDSASPETLRRVEDELNAPLGFVSLDSDHTRDHVLKELRLYSHLVPVGGHLVVEDTNINGHPVHPGFGPGPFEAVELFLSENAAFGRDDALWQRNLFSHHQYGWLRRLA